MKRILVVHGPNLNLLGTREPETYGRVTLEEIDTRLRRTASEGGVYLETFQSNSEGDLVTKIQGAGGVFDWVILNLGALSHTSIAIRDALAGSRVRGIEVHLTNPHRREAFRHNSTIADLVVGRIMGFGDHSYDLALRVALEDWAAP